jgi:hypothetical protein
LLRACFKRHVFGGFALKYDYNKGAERWQGGTSEAVPPIKTGLIHPTRDHFILLKQALRLEFGEQDSGFKIQKQTPSSICLF